MMDGEQGRQWAARADHVLAGGPATYSKHWSRFAQGITPVALTHGDGCRVWDVDGRAYLDTIGALGPMLLGYRHPVVDAAVHAQVDRGASFSLLHPLEVEVAEQLCALIPGAERVRFGKNGKDVTEAAVRLARAATQRRHICCAGYHGGNEFYLVSTPHRAGLLAEIQPYTHQLPWGDRLRWQRTLERCGRDLAAVIVEVPPEPWGQDESGAFLSWLMARTEALGAVFILDEVVTALRYGVGGAAAAYGVRPDLICLGKSLANGYPLAALVGRADLMRALGEGVFWSTTFGGEAVSLAAAQATLGVLQATETLATLRRLGHQLGQGLVERFQAHALPVQVRGNFARLILAWQETAMATAAELRTLWLQEMAQRGVLCGGPWLPMGCYTEADVGWLLAQAEEAMEAIALALRTGHVTDRLQAPVATVVFEARYAPLEAR